MFSNSFSLTDLKDVMGVPRNELVPFVMMMTATMGFVMTMAQSFSIWLNEISEIEVVLNEKRY